MEEGEKLFPNVSCWQLRVQKGKVGLFLLSVCPEVMLEGFSKLWPFQISVYSDHTEFMLNKKTQCQAVLKE